MACSISAQESSSLLNIACQALKDLPEVEFWVKPHPYLRIKDLLRHGGIDVKNIPFIIKDQPIEEVLTQSSIVIVGESSVSLEALALGCSVVIVNVPEWMNMSPVKDVQSPMIQTVNNPQQLRAHILGIINSKKEYPSSRAQV